MADASQLTDDELKEVIETGVEPETPESEIQPDKVDEPSKSEESKESETKTEEVPEAEAKVEPPEEEGPKAPSRREQLRVQDLLAKYGTPKEKQPQTKGPDFRTKVEADEDTYKTIEDTATEFGRNQYEQGLERAKYYQWETLLNVDEPQVRSKYPELDPHNKEKFHPALHKAMTGKYAAFVGYDAGDPEKGIARSVRNPEIRFLDFVESEMEFADELAAQRVERTTENIVKQAAQTGLRPDGSTSKKLNLNQAPQNMTLEELYASIGQTPPKN